MHSQAMGSLPAADVPIAGEVIVDSTDRSMRLFGISFLILFLELACIRWFPAHVLYLTFFTNVVLVASFLGMSLGCLAARQTRNYIKWTPVVLVIGMLLTLAAELEVFEFQKLVDVGRQDSPQFVYFGAEYHVRDVARFPVPVEVINGIFFLLIAVAFMGPGQELGRAFQGISNRLQAYSWNIAGSLAGIVVFGLMSWFQCTPLWWFAISSLLLLYFLVRVPDQRKVPAFVSLALIVVCASLTSGEYQRSAQIQHHWSPYYRIDLLPDQLAINANKIGHQVMVSRDQPGPAYELPYLLRRDSGGAPIKDILVIGAGSGNDVSRALKWGADRIDAVEIDPVIHRLGSELHPDRPYSDDRVHVTLDDGRNFLRGTDRQYDMVVYALVDSLVLHSSYSNLRLESYLFTEQAFQDVRRHLKPDGIFVVYNFFRQGWIVSRLYQDLRKTFDADPIVLTMPQLDHVRPGEAYGGFTLMYCGSRDAVEKLRQQFEQQPFRIPPGTVAGPDSPNGFAVAAGGTEFAPAAVTVPEGLQSASDHWPYLYLRNPMLPSHTIRGMAIMGLISFLLMAWVFRANADVVPVNQSMSWFNQRMFFLGAAFLLIETRAVVHMALLFGSTWMVNSIVFAAVLIMVLAANGYVLWVKPRQLWPYYVGLFVVLGIGLLVPLDAFLGKARWVQIVGASLLVFVPILLAGVIFAVTFAQSRYPDRDFGANVAGSVVGGLAENFSLLLGFRYLLFVAMAFYFLSIWGRRSVRRTAPVHCDRELVGVG